MPGYTRSKVKEWKEQQMGWHYAKFELVTTVVLR